MHLKESQYSNLHRSWVSPSYQFTFNSQAPGVAILIHYFVPFKCTTVGADRNGGYVIVIGSIHNIPLLLARFYAPYHDDGHFFVKFLSSIPNIESHCLIIGSDFNYCLNQMLDSSSSTYINASRSSRIWLFSMIWRLRY